MYYIKGNLKTEKYGIDRIIEFRNLIDWSYTISDSHLLTYIFFALIMKNQVKD